MTKLNKNFNKNEQSSTSAPLCSSINSSKKLKHKAKDPYTVIKISDIHYRIPFNIILHEASKFDKNIIGIFRRADYRNKRLGHDVFLYSVSPNINEEFLNKISLCFEGYNKSSLSVEDYVIGSAQIIKSAFTSPNKCIPPSICIKRVTKIDVGNGITGYLADLSKKYENQGITSIRLNYDPIKSRTKDCGFITLLSNAIAKSIVDENQKKKDEFDSDNFKLELSNGVPMLVKRENSDKMPRGKLEWSNDIEAINMLITRHQAPAIHPRGNEKDIHTGEEEPNVGSNFNKRKLEVDEQESFDDNSPAIISYMNKDPTSDANEEFMERTCWNCDQNPTKVIILEA